MTHARDTYHKVQEICLALPDTKETLTWGKPHFRVGEKIFAGCEQEEGRSTIGFKLTMDHAQAVLADSRFQRAPYVGHKGWVSMDVSAQRDWDEVRSLIFESYRLIAPKKSLAKLEGEAPARSRSTAPNAPKKKKAPAATRNFAKPARKSSKRSTSKAAGSRDHR